MSRKKKWLVIATLLILFYMIDFIMPTLKQEDRVGAIILSGFKVMITKEDMVKYHEDDFGSYYLTETKSSDDIIKDFMQENDWIFKDQMGSGYLFEREKNENTLTVSSRQFTRYFRIWFVPADYEKKVVNDEKSYCYNDSIIMY